MQLFAPSLAFVDLETTGTQAAGDRITEVAVVRVEANPDGSGAPKVEEWSTLVNPGVPIPPEIQALTGITNDMVRAAPRFAAIADEIAARTANAVFVAHNARFDYGFLKHAFARLDRTFTARVLCTVRLSRRLFPEADRHNLDSVIARHALRVDGRHRALGDARVLWAFVQTLYRDLPVQAIEDAARRVLRTPSLPPQLPPDVLDAVPEAPGVYLFYGPNPLPLYIGKSKNLRERVGAHFSSDYRSATDLRLSAEIRRIEFEETAGEIGALLREAALVKAMLPAHNHALRRKAEAGILELPDEPGPPRFVSTAGIEPAELAGRFGPFSSRRGGARDAAQSRRPSTDCAGRRSASSAASGRVSRGRWRAARARASGPSRPRSTTPGCAPPLHRMRFRRGPLPASPRSASRALFGARVDVHVVKDWCWLGTARDDGELGHLRELPPRPQFDADIARLLMRVLARRRHEAFALA